VIESLMVARFIRALLVADAGIGGVNTLVGGRIYRGRKPQGQPLPAVTIVVATDPDHNTMNGTHVYQDVQVDVTVRCEGEDYGPIEPISRRIFTVLQGASGLQDGVTIVKLRRVDSQELIPVTKGKAYAQLVQTFLTEAVPA
jgi:hypothetical protein